MGSMNVNVSEGIATITFNRPKSLNAFTPEDYSSFSETLREIDQRDDVVVTVWQATGKWFCAGTDVKNRMLKEHQPSVRHYFLQTVAGTTTDCGHALSSHSKILVAALNGPVMGIAAAFLGHFDFIYCMPSTYLSTPFTFLGLASEGGASVSFVNKMGLAKANEVLIWGRKKEAEELLQCGFVNKIFPSQPVDSFHSAVRNHLLTDMDGLDPVALLRMKKLIRAGLNDKNDFDAVNLRESISQAELFATSRPLQRFAAIAAKKIKHKL